MKMYELGTLIIITIISLCVVAGLASKIWYGDDNPIEETAEKIIELETGIDIDLSPDSKEHIA